MKIYPRNKLKAEVARLKREGKKVVFTNGCFDILHAGHTRYLREAKKLGDVLILALNSDRSVRAIKGQKRPI
ncbi:MAG TPA: adenylyltransferase/cytidyltransferase family protein, partial [Syntrophales bacterium]